MEEFGFVVNIMITERNPPGHQELETLSALSPTPNQVTEPSSPTRKPVIKSVEPVLAESTGREEDAKDCDDLASGAPTDRWTRNEVAFSLEIYPFLAAINL